MKIGLVFCVMNNFKGLTEAIWSAKSKNDLQVYIRPQWIEPRPSLAAAWNAGAKEAFADGCDYALVCNDDIMFSPDTIDAMVEQYELLHESDKIIMVTPNNIKLQLGAPYEIMNYVRPPDAYTYSEHPNFSCFLISPDYFDKIGTFDENFYPAWYEDSDAHSRANRLGYKLIVTTAAPMVHIGGVATSMMENPDSGVSQAYFIKKWGGLPYSHPVPDDIKEHYPTPYNDSKLTPKDWIMQ